MPCYLPNLSVSVHTPKFLAKVGQVATLAAIVTYLTVSLRAENSVWPFCTCLYAPNFKVEKSWELSEPQGLKVGKNIELLFWTCRGHFDHNFVRFDHKNLWQKCSIVGGGWSMDKWTDEHCRVTEKQGVVILARTIEEGLYSGPSEIRKPAQLEQNFKNVFYLEMPKSCTTLKILCTVFAYLKVFFCIAEAVHSFGHSFFLNLKQATSRRQMESTWIPICQFSELWKSHGKCFIAENVLSMSFCAVSLFGWELLIALIERLGQQLHHQFGGKQQNNKYSRVERGQTLGICGCVARREFSEFCCRATAFSCGFSLES